MERWVQALALWHLLALAGALVVDWELFVPLLVWTLVAVGLWNVQPGPYIPVALGLAVAEETLVYAFGGGLHGTAESLTHDLVVTLPTFTALVLGWYAIASRYQVSRSVVFLLAGLHGVVLELVVGGLGVSPAVWVLFGAPVIVIYGSIVAGPRLPTGTRRFGARAAIGAWIAIFGGLAVSGVVADHLVSALL